MATLISLTNGDDTSLNASSNTDLKVNGFAGNDTITTGSGNDSPSGWAGNDIIRSGAGNDTVDGAAGNDTVIAGSGQDDIRGGDGDDLLKGDIGNDKIIGGRGNDTINGGFGNDTLGGGEGNDWLDGGEGDDTLTGGEGDDRLYGQTGKDTLVGGTGNDSLFGGLDIDELRGDEGDDFLDGGVDADKMYGGTGNDTYIVDNAGDQVIERVGEGLDLIRSSINFSLGNAGQNAANVENLTLTGTANLNGSGNDLDNRIEGNTGDNILAGGKGNDTLRGGAGNDTYVFKKGDGLDTVTDSGTTNSLNDALNLADITKTDVRFSFAGGNLKVSYAGSTATDVVTLTNQNSANFKVENIISADGTKVDVNSVISLINTYAASQGVSAASLNLDNAGLQNYLLANLAWA
jgi:Ca2+-binding RTX toxin-like protein